MATPLMFKVAFSAICVLPFVAKLRGVQKGKAQGFQKRTYSVAKPDVA